MNCCVRYVCSPGGAWGSIFYTGPLKGAKEGQGAGVYNYKAKYGASGAGGGKSEERGGKEKKT